MKRKRFPEEQIISILREREAGMKVADLGRKNGVSEQSIYRWQSKYGGLGVSEARRLKQLEEENRRLKRMVADLSLDKQMLEDVIKQSKKLVTPAAKRRAAGHLLKTHRVSERRVCRLLKLHRSVAPIPIGQQKGRRGTQGPCEGVGGPVSTLRISVASPAAEE